MNTTRESIVRVLWVELCRNRRGALSCCPSFSRSYRRSRAQPIHANLAAYVSIETDLRLARRENGASVFIHAPSNARLENRFTAEPHTRTLSTCVSFSLDDDHLSFIFLEQDIPPIINTSLLNKENILLNCILEEKHKHSRTQKWRVRKQ